LARIAEAEIERLKAEVSVERLAEGRGIELRRHGADLLGLCPFHADHEPSLVITPKKNLWHCLGACQAGGSVIDWVIRAEGVSFRHAVELLRADMAVTPGERVVRQSTVRKLPAPVATDAEDSELLAQVTGYYHQTLLESEEALAYLERRGLRSVEAVERFRLGYANRTLGYRLPAKNRRDGDEIRSRLQRLGILRRSGHEHLTGSLVVPVFDERGQVVEMYGRKLNDNLRAGTPLHLYLPGPHRGVWNVEALGAGEEVIVCEALLDALTFWVHGIRNVTAAYGVEGFTADHLDAFRRHGVGRALIAYDRDAAGDRAAVELAVRLVGAGIDCYRVQLPQGQDVNSFAGEDLGSAPERLARVLRNAVWLGKGRPPAPRPTSAPDADVPRLIPRPVTAAKEGDSSPPSDPPFAALDEPPVDSGPPPPIPASSPPQDATPVPTAPPEPRAELSGEELLVQLGDRRWRVRGLARTTSFDSLRLNLMVRRDDGEGMLSGGEGARFHVDTIDLYSARQRQTFTVQAAAELGLAEDAVRHDLGQLLLCCEGMAEELARRAAEPQSEQVVLSEEEQRAALEYLRSPDLLERILLDFERCGVVGEETNKLVAYLAATSRLLDQPLAVIVQSTSAAGKSVLLESVLALIPEEGRIKYSAMTGQSLYYMAERDLAHKVLAVVEEEGAEKAAYALKLLQSEGELRIASTGKDPSTGRLTTQEYRVQGPVALFLTTTAVDVDEELLNRCLVLSVDEEREQTRAIHERQREGQTLAGLLAGRDHQRILALHHNVQRMLRPVLVVNPYAHLLTFTDARTRTRRDHAKYLTLIRTVALLFQHQRERRQVEHEGETIPYLEVTPEDIAVANRLAGEVLGRSLDELPPRTRRLLLLVDELVSRRGVAEGVDRGDVRVSRREVREHTGWGDTQLKCHLARLVELEHLLVHRGGRGQSFVYELLWDGAGRDGSPALSGLIDPARLTEKHGYDADRSGPQASRSGSGRPSVGGWSGPGRPSLPGENPNGHQELPAPDPSSAAESAHLEGPENRSYPWLWTGGAKGTDANDAANEPSTRVASGTGGAP
jgi:hypothetical protein